MAPISLAEAAPDPRPSVAPPKPSVSKGTYDGLLLECERAAKLLKVRKDKDILVADRHHESLYVVHSGWFIRYKLLHTGSRQIVDFILPGEIFGLQLCRFKTSLYSVASITDAMLSAIPLTAVNGILERNPKLSKTLLWSAICEAAILSEHLTDAARRSAYERVSHLLLELFVRLRRAGATRGMSFHMPVTQEHIGDALGLTKRGLHVDDQLDIGDLLDWQVRGFSPLIILVVLVIENDGKF